ncbi:MAG: peptide chain release factor 2 [Bacilli bacterium]
MDTREIINKLNFYKKELDTLRGSLDLENKEKEILTLETQAQEETFWDNPQLAKTTLERLSSLKTEKDMYNNLLSRIKSDEEIISLVDEEEMILLDNEYNKLISSSLLCGEYDNTNAYIEIHSGAGGTESNDWANMLYNMYIKYAQLNNLNIEKINEQPGEEVGLKGALIKLSGQYAYGLLKSETGVHRLVRISPFDSNSRRHTSFASVLVTPEIKTDINIDIKDEDVKIDVYHSSGAGGQSVNTTDSAVRITHLPTKIVVTCQNERSQLQNKQKAFEILKNKLFLLEKSKIDEKLSDIRGGIMDVNFGSQIRSYVMCPYTMVKDTRTNAETSDVQDVLNGNINIFIDAYLKNK